MEASSTYRLLIVRGERRAVLIMGQEQFGPPDEATLAHLESIDDSEEMLRLAVRLLHVSSWQELLAPATE